MVTNIGNTDDKIIISDNATVASSTYAWYLPASTYDGKWPLGPIGKSRVLCTDGTATGTSSLTADIVKNFREIPMTSWTNYSNLQKALAYWSKKDSLLYLSFKSDGTNNVAVVAHFADVNTTSGAVTLSQFTGKLRNYSEGKFVSDSCYVNIDMYYVYYVEA